jgi:TonB family protein
MPIRGLLLALLLLTVSPQNQPRLPIHVESLIYPQLARQARITGDAVLVAHIGSDGTVSIPIRKSGHPLLLQVAEDNLKKWRFQRGEDQEMEITYHFKLTKTSSDSAQTECVFDLPASVMISSPLPPVETNYSSPKGKPAHK